MTVSTKSNETSKLIHVAIVALLVINIALTVFSMKSNDLESTLNKIEAMKV